MTDMIARAARHVAETRVAGVTGAPTSVAEMANVIETPRAK
jgi:hypothetical protein